jgi:hypothetical protein
VQVPEFSWLSLNKRDDLSPALQAGGWGDICPGDIIHVMIAQPPPRSPVALPAASSSPKSSAARQPTFPPAPVSLPPAPVSLPPAPVSLPPAPVSLPSAPNSLPSAPVSLPPAPVPAPPVATIAVTSSRADIPVPTSDFSPTFFVLQSLATSLSLPQPHIRRLRDGSAAARGGTTAQGFSAVASIVGAAVCVLVSSAGGCCSAQLPLLCATAADPPSSRAAEEAWKQVSCGSRTRSAVLAPTSHFALLGPQLIQQSRAILSPNSVSDSAADALSQVAAHVNEHTRAAMLRVPQLSQLGAAGLLAAAVMCICR